MQHRLHRRRVPPSRPILIALRCALPRLAPQQLSACLHLGLQFPLGGPLALCTLRRRRVVPGYRHARHCCRRLGTPRRLLARGRNARRCKLRPPPRCLSVRAATHRRTRTSLIARACVARLSAASGARAAVAFASTAGSTESSGVGSTPPPALSAAALSCAVTRAAPATALPASTNSHRTAVSVCARARSLRHRVRTTLVRPLGATRVRPLGATRVHPTPPASV